MINRERLANISSYFLEVPNRNVGRYENLGLQSFDSGNGIKKGLSKIALLLIMSLLLLIAPIVTSAQAISGLTGIVTDSSGSVIPGASVKLTDTKIAKDITVKTNDQGVYLFSNVAPGQGYKLTVTIQGFQTAVIDNVGLGVSKTETQNVQMTAGQVTETVEIVTSSGDATLNTSDASIGNVINSRQMRQLPIQIRNSPAALLSLQPGVVGNNIGTGMTNRVGSTTGSRADQGNITIDGIDANDQATGQAFATVGNAPIDSVQEFRATVLGPNASQGRSSGGQIDLVTKSGTNDIHGNLYEYNRTAYTAANSFFNNKNGVTRPQLTRNQYGGSLGGPLPFPHFGEGGPVVNSGKDKLFFFFNYEGRRDAQGVTYTRIVPLDSYRNGGLGYINNNAGCTAASRLNTTPNCITILTPAQVKALDPKAIGGNQALLSFLNGRYPHANDLTQGDGVNTGGFRFNAPSSRADSTYSTRIDGNITSKQKVFGRLTIASRVQTDTVNNVAAEFPGDPTGAQIVDKSYSWVVGHSWVISPTLFNQATVGLSASILDFPNNLHPSFPNDFAFGGLSAPFADFSTQSRDVYTPTIRDDLTWNKGSHNFTFGTQIKPIASKSGLVADFNTVGIGLGGNTASLDDTLRPGNILSDTANNTTASSIYDSAFATLLGRYASIDTNFNYDTSGKAFAPGSGKKRDFRYNEFEIYANDNWKIRNDLTLNLGVRWSYYQAPYEKNGFQTGPSVDYQALLDQRVKNAAAGIGGDAAEPFLSYSLIGKGNNGPAYYKSDLNNFAPRLGLAYSPSFDKGFLKTLFGDRKTSIRAGGSVVYDRVGGGITFIQDQVSYLFDGTKNTLFGDTDARTALLTDPRFTGINTLPLQNVAPPITNPNTPFVDSGSPFGNIEGQQNYALSQNFRTPYSVTYSLGVQRELPGGYLIDVSYVGRQGRKLFTQSDAAQLLNFKDPKSGQLMYDAFNALQAQIASGVSNANITAQPWFENQMSAAIGAPCTAIAPVTSCTQYIARTSLRSLVTIGDTADTVQALASQGLLRNNVGLSGQFSTNAYITNQGSSSYNGMLVSLQKRFSQGLSFDLNYTYSHSIDNQSSVVSTVFGGLVCDVQNLRTCRADSDFDIRHIINVNGIYDLPFGRGKSIGGNMPKWLDALVGGWTVSGIYTYRSGLPMSTTTSAFPVSFVLAASGELAGPSAIFQSNIHDVGSVIQYFNDPTTVAKGFRFPHHGESGNRNVLRGPSFWNVDTAVLKNIKLPWSEKQTLQLRWEAYNAFNHNSFGNPGLGVGSATFGQITTSASTPREMQFALRFDF